MKVCNELMRKKRIPILIRSVCACLVLFVILASVPAIAKAAEQVKPKLMVTVKDAHNATIKITGINVPEKFKTSYSGYEDGEIVYNWNVSFGDYAVGLQYVPFLIQERINNYGDTELTAHELYLTGQKKVVVDGKTRYYDDDGIDISLEAGKDYLSFELYIADEYNIDMSKIKEYIVRISTPEEKCYLQYAADSAGEVSRDVIGTSVSSVKNGKKAISETSISGIKNKAYTGKAISQSVTIKDGSTTLKKDKDYTISYKNNKSIGIASMVIKGKGDYTGSIDKTFKITPQKVTLFSLKLKSKDKNTAVLSWKKVSEATGYIIYCKAGNGSYKKVKTITKNTTLSYTVKNLEEGNTYSYKVRAYKKVDKTNYYSSYSAIKSIAIKGNNQNKQTKTEKNDYRLKVEVSGKNCAKIIATDPNLKETYKVDILDNINFIREWDVRFWMRDKWDSPHTYMVYVRLADSSKDGVTKRNIKDCEGYLILVSDIMEVVCPTTFTVEGKNLIWKFTIPDEYLKEPAQKLNYDDFDLSKAENFKFLIRDGVDESKSITKEYSAEDVLVIK